MAKKNKTKEKIKCPICDKSLIKQYISHHLRKMHKDNIYCKIIQRGMTYNIFNFHTNNVSNKDQYYCKICNKSMDKNSKYKHIKTKLHLILEQKEKHRDFLNDEHRNNEKLKKNISENYFNNNKANTLIHDTGNNYFNYNKIVDKNLGNLDINNSQIKEEKNKLLKNNDNLLKDNSNKKESQLSKDNCELKNQIKSKENNHSNDSNIKIFVIS